MGGRIGRSRDEAKGKEAETVTKEKTTKRPVDTELRTIRRMMGVLEGLPQSVQMRVIEYIRNRIADRASVQAGQGELEI